MNDSQHNAPRIGIVRRGLRRLKRAVYFLLACIALYFLSALAGLIPVNNDFQPAAEGVDIWLLSNPIHTDFVLPITNETFDWRSRLPPGSFAVDASRATHVAIGWGNKEFYVNTPTWADVRAATVARALCWPSESVMHVSLAAVDMLPPDARRVRISASEYRHLAEFIDGSFRHAADGRAVPLDHPGYGPADAFFEAEGRYHCFNTCNCWTGRALRSAGIRVGWYTPLPGTVLLYLPHSP